MEVGEIYDNPLKKETLLNSISLYLMNLCKLGFKSSCLE